MREECREKKKKKQERKHMENTGGEECEIWRKTARREWEWSGWVN